MWITVREAAELLGISKRAVRKRVKEGKMKAKKVKMNGGEGYLVWIEEGRNQVPQSGADWGTEGRNQSKGRNQAGNAVMTGNSEGDLAKGWNQGGNRLRNQNGGSDMGGDSGHIGRFEIWISVKEAARLLGITERAVRKRINDGDIVAKEVPGKGGDGGKVYRVLLSSLPGEVQVRYLRGEFAKFGVSESKVMEGIMEVDVDKLEIVIRFLAIRARGENVVEEGKKLVEEYKRRGMRVSLKSLYRWVREYEEKGEEAFVSRRGGEKGVRSFDEEALKYGIGLYLDKRKFSIKDCYEMMCERAKEKGWRVGSYKSFARILKEIPEKVKVLAREGEKVYRAEYLPKVRRRTDDLEVNEIWVMDHTPLNIMVYEKGKVIRPWITVAMDLRTRMIAGLAVVRYPSGDSIALALRHGMLKKKPPRILKIEGEFYWPIYGVPRELYLDNGKDFRARRFWGDREDKYRVEVEEKVVKGLKVIGIEPRFATPYWSWSKGWIERFFRTLKGYVQTLPGGWRNRKNMSEQDRSRVKEAIDKGELLTIEELFEMIGIWIAYRYHLSEHRGLPKRRGRHLSPLEYFEEIKEKEGVEFRVVSERALDFLLMKTAKKKVFKDGIHLNGFIYQSLELAPYISQKVDVYWDPLDVSEVYVYVKGRYVCRAVSDMVMSMKREYGDISEGDLRAVQRERRRIEKRDRELIKFYTRGVEVPEVVERVMMRRKAVENAGNVKETRLISDMDRLARERDKGSGLERIKGSKRKLILWEFEKDEKNSAGF